MQQNKDDDVYGYTQGMIYEHVSNCKDNFKCKRSGLHYISVIWIRTLQFHFRQNDYYCSYNYKCYLLSNKI